MSDLNFDAIPQKFRKKLFQKSPHSGKAMLYEEAYKLFQRNPYYLLKRAGIDSLKFRDQILFQCGMSEDDSRRLCEYAIDAAKKNDEGHTVIPIIDAVHHVGQPYEKVLQAITSHPYFIVFDNEYLSPISLKHEGGIKQRLDDLLLKPALDFDYSKLPDQLSDEQREAIKHVTSTGIGVLCGHPGTGKTFAIRTLTKALRKAGFTVEVCATTGMAARRLDLDGARTMHSMLGGRPLNNGSWRFKYDEDSPLKADIIICDEASMLSSEWMYWLLCYTSARILLVADYNQLPPVSKGAPLRDVIAYPYVPSVTLEKCFRNTSHLLALTTAIRAGDFIDGEFFGNDMISHIGRSQPNRHIVLFIKQRNLAESDVRVICATNKMRASLNFTLQDYFNSANKCSDRYWPESLCCADKPFAYDNSGNFYDYQREEEWNELNVEHKGLDEKEKEQLRKRNPFAFAGSILNGEEGRIVKYTGGLEPSICAKFGEVTIYKIPEKYCKLGYALTCHKAQGGQYRNVVVVLEGKWLPMCERSWIYTATSRPTDHLAVVQAWGVKSATINSLIRRGFALPKRRTFFNR